MIWPQYREMTDEEFRKMGVQRGEVRPLSALSDGDPIFSVIEVAPDVYGEIERLIRSEVRRSIPEENWPFVNGEWPITWKGMLLVKAQE